MQIRHEPRARGVRNLWVMARLLGAACLFLLSPAWAAELKPWTGGALPPLALKDLEGRAHALEAYRGQVVIVNFWATWCAPCREEMPSFNALRRSLEGRPVVFLAVNMGDGEGRIAEFLKAVPIEFPVLLDREARVAKAWKVRLLPTTFIIGRDGRVRSSVTGEIDWAAASVRANIAALAEERSAR